MFAFKMNFIHCLHLRCSLYTFSIETNYERFVKTVYCLKAERAFSNNKYLFYFFFFCAHQIITYENTNELWAGNAYKTNLTLVTSHYVAM